MKMKKLLMLIAVSAMTMGFVTGCGSNEVTDASQDVEMELEAGEDMITQESADGSDNEDSAESDRTELVVGFDAEFPPYGYMDENGEYVGFDLSLAQEVCDRMGWELVKQPIDWDAKDMELSTGAIDCIWNGFTINGREDSYTWTIPYVDNSQVIVVSVNSEISSFDALAGKNVGVQSDSSALAALTDEDDNAENLALAASFASLNQFGDYNTAFMDLEAGAIDAIAMDVGVADYQIKSREGKFVKLDQPLATEQYGIGFFKGNDSLRDTVEETLMEMVEDGTFMEIAEEWGLKDSVCLGKEQ